MNVLKNNEPISAVTNIGWATLKVCKLDSNGYPSTADTVSSFGDLKTDIAYASGVTNTSSIDKYTYYYFFTATSFVTGTTSESVSTISVSATTTGGAEPTGFTYNVYKITDSDNGYALAVEITERFDGKYDNPQDLYNIDLKVQTSESSINTTLSFTFTHNYCKEAS